MQNSTRRSIPYPQLDRSDVPDIPQHFKNLIDFLDVDTPYYSGTLAARPAFNAAGHRAGEWYYATDTGVLYFNTGAAWVQITSKAPTITYITATGTYTTPTGCRAIIVECTGGGGGAAPNAQTAPGTGGAGGSGGGGAYSRKYITNPTATYAVTVGAGGAAGVVGGANPGAGGDTIFGSSVVLAKGGGASAPSAVTVNGQLPGAGGGLASAGVGDVKLDGGDAGYGWWNGSAGLCGSGIGGRAAGPYAGDPGQAVVLGAGGRAAGLPASLYGSGSSGGIAWGTGLAPFNAFAGAAGLIVVTELY